METKENSLILDLAHKACWDEYKEHSEIWKTIETKAQTLITTCGIFLAGIFAFARDLSHTDGQRCIMVLSLLFLLAAMAAALRVLKVAYYEMPVDALFIVDHARNLTHAKESGRPDGDRLATIYNTLLSQHRISSKSISEQIQIKVDRLRYAYRLAQAAVLLGVAATTMRLMGQ